jgi:Cu-Zn family superoxide dismutase
MKDISFVLAFSFLIFLGVLSAQAEHKKAKAELMNSKGEIVGLATLVEGTDGVLVTINVWDLSPGLHGFHIHEVGKCEPPDFKTAGAHFNPFERKHGLKNPMGPHAGDSLNLQVGPDGTGTQVTMFPLVSLGSGINSLFHQGGTALVMHAMKDDQMTDPSGDSGARIACGVISKY